VTADASGELFLGIDLGTSEIKVVLLSARGEVVSTTGEPLALSRAQAGWSEQDPHAWWQACCTCIDRLTRAGTGARVRGIGLSGQMHGAVLLDSQRRLLRSAMLWNDVRCAAECAQLRESRADYEALAGNLAMPGFTAPKLLWLQRHEPQLWERIAHVLLPKDYLRLQLTGELATDASDASGTLWLDIARRDWSAALLAAGGMRAAQLPPVLEGSAVAGTLHAELAQRWGMRSDVVVAAGAGDNAAGAVGIGAVRPGQGFASLGTSGVVFVVTDRHRPHPAGAIHAFCHALPQCWHQMSVMLSAASCLRWVVRLCGQRDEAAALQRAAALDAAQRARAPLFLPYLGGERTPHNDAMARAMFHGLDHEHDPAALVWSVIEGVAFGLRDGLLAMDGAVRDSVRELDLVGGGARSGLWAQLVADALGVPLRLRPDNAAGAAIGAARLGWLAAGGSLSDLQVRDAGERVEPSAEHRDTLLQRYARFRALYPACR
jgi:xylulokinase